MSDHNMSLRIPYATPLPDKPKEPNPTEKRPPTSSETVPKRFVYVALKALSRIHTTPAPQAVLATSITENKILAERYPSFSFYNDISGPDDEAISVVIDNTEHATTICLGWANSQLGAWKIIEKEVKNCEQHYKKQQPVYGPYRAEGETEDRFEWASWVLYDDLNVRCSLLKVELLREFDLKETLQMRIMARTAHGGQGEIGLYSERVKEEGRGPWVTLESAYYGKYYHPTAKSMATKGRVGEEENEGEGEKKLLEDAGIEARKQDTEEWAGFEEAKEEEGW